VDVLRVYVEDASDSLWPQLGDTPIRLVKLSGGHHFAG
jgi:type IV secretory pathway VirJ component